MNGSDSSVSRSQRTRTFLVAAALLAALGLVSLFAAPALAGAPLNGGPEPLPGSFFQGADGDQKTPTLGDLDFNPLRSPALKDWQSYIGSAKLSTIPDASGLEDTWFFHGKEEKPSGWDFRRGAVTPAKADVLGAWTVTDPSSDDVFLNLAFNRSSAGGSTFFNFELNQLSTTWENGNTNSYDGDGDGQLDKTVIPCRRNGDIIVSFELQGNAGDVGVAVRRWQSTKPGPAACPEGSEGAFTQAGLVDGTINGVKVAQGAMNASSIPNYFTPAPSDQLPIDTFGEASLNLTDILGSLGDSCFSFGQIQMHTRSAPPFDADLKDFIAPKPIIARSCSIAGTKYHDSNGNGERDTDGQGNFTEPPLSGFRIYADANGNGAFDAGEPATFTQADGSWVLTGLGAATYTIREDLTNPAGGNSRAGQGWTCTDPGTNDAGLPAGVSVPAPCAFSVPLAQGSTVENLEFGNFKQPTIRVEKNLIPASDPGRFDLRVDDTAVKTAAADEEGGTTAVSVGTHSVSEAGANGTDLTKYAASVACTKNGSPYLAGDGSSLGNLAVTSGDAVVCRITNQRKQGSMTVRKQLVPESDTGKFALSVGETVVNPSAGDNEGGSTAVDPGTYTVSEAGVGGTALAKYDSSWACSKNGTAYKTGSGSSLAGVDVDSDDTVVCEVTNVRRKAGITVVKQLVPESDASEFALSVGGTVVNPAAGDDEGGTAPVDRGTYTVSEAGAAGTDIAKYDSSVACVKNGVEYKSGEGTSLGGIEVDSNDAVTCTLTNERRPASIIVRKQLVPESDSGRFALSVGQTVVNASAGDNDEGALDVAPGTYGVSEAGANGTDLGRYDSNWKCAKNGAGYKSGDGTSLAGIEVDSNDAVVCEVTNTKRARVQIVKTEAGGKPAGTWTFTLTGGPEQVELEKLTDAQGAIDFGFLAPGTYELCETDIPSDWHTSLERAPYSGSRQLDGAGTVKVCVTVALDPGDEDPIVVDNTRPAQIVVKGGDKFVHHGEDTTFTFDVTNTGNVPLYDIDLEDTKCTGAIDGPVSKSGGDDDGTFEPGETWRYSCTMPVPAHSGDEQNPIVNVVTAAADDDAAPGRNGNVVTDNSEWTTWILHPDIALDKKVHIAGQSGGFVDGPVTAHAGDTAEYRVTVENTGDAAVTLDIDDNRCELTLQSGDLDTDGRLDADELVDTDGDGKLDGAETWTYTCSVVLQDPDGDGEAVLDDPFENTVTATGKDQTERPNDETPERTDKTTTDLLLPAIHVEKQVRKAGAGEFGERVALHVGDQAEYRMVVTNTGDDTPLQAVTLTDPNCAPIAGPTGDEGDQLLEAGEEWTYTCVRTILEGDPNVVPNVATATGYDALERKVTDDDGASVQVIKPATLVVKEGNVFAYPGDTVTFTFAVTNNGNTPLSDVTVTDDRCAPVTGPAQKLDGNQDGLLDPGEKWIFTCSKQIPPGHKIGDENPIRNVATATGKDALGKTVESHDDHLVRVLHPAIDIEKTGPATAVAGTPLAYTLTVTNPGDVPFAAQEVGVSDPRCEQPPAGPSTSGDATPGQLDPGDKRTYTCTAQTAGLPAGTFVNTATVTVKDFNGREVSDSDDFPTVLETQQVLTSRPGSSRLSGPSGCVRKPFKAIVRGSRIARVTFFRDGKRIKAIKAKPGQRRFVVRVKPSKRPGVHRITARVVYRSASGTRARTLRLSYQRCARQVVRPRFTG